MENFNIKSLGIGLVVTVVCVALMGSAFRSKGIAPGDVAPAFSESGTDGKTHSLKSLTAKTPVVLYFIKIGCPVNQRAIPYFNKIADAYKGKATLVGVINGDMAAAKQWKEDNGASYTILADSDNSTIRAYKAMYSPWAVTIKQDGKIAKSLPGGSKDELTVINDFMAAAAKTAPSKIAFDGAPRGGG